MEGWVQFKFAQGSPDKELRFKKALQEVAARKNLAAYPSIFAWHGSALPNWHSIVRSGLDYDDIRCGRAYGNGVYFSPYQSTSLSYAGSSSAPWPNSDLKFTYCMSLNEIINAPDEFVSTSPHYVVSQNDWHQCRYLFVKSSKGIRRINLPRTSATSSQPMTPSSSSDGRLYNKQAPEWEIKNMDCDVVKIPLAAVPQRNVDSTLKRPSSGIKRLTRALDAESESEDIEDIAGLLSDEEDVKQERSRLFGKTTASRSTSANTVIREPYGEQALTNDAMVTYDSSKTDFRPGSLDLGTLPRLDEPSWATDIATKALSRKLNTLQKTPASPPLHELGWYIDFDHVENLYQWIVELHSFEDDLPLAQDMKDDGMTSIVMEVRFPRSFPFEPPFIRVVRPRFLPFLEGGGGHITAGGAVCMELLTTSGWSPASSMESVLLQVRMAMCSVDPRPGRLVSSRVRQSNPHDGSDDYGVGDAIEAYIRAARTHGWTVPNDVRQTANGT